MRATNGHGFGITTVDRLVGKISTGDATNAAGSRVAYLSDTNGLGSSGDFVPRTGTNMTGSLRLNSTASLSVSNATPSTVAKIGADNMLTSYANGEALPVLDGRNLTNLFGQSISFNFPTNIPGQTLYSSHPSGDTDTNNDFVVVYSVGQVHGFTNRGIWMTRYTNTLNSWSTPSLVISNNGIDNATVSFGISKPSGRFVMMFPQTLVPSNVSSNAYGQYSDDKGSTWTPFSIPSLPGSSAYNQTNWPFGRVVNCANGRLMNGYYEYGSVSKVNGAAYVLYSDDNAVTWTTNFAVSSTTLGLQEPFVEYLGNSNVLMMIRCEQNSTSTSSQWLQCQSTNNGLTWSSNGLVSAVSVGTARNPAALYFYNNGLTGPRVVMSWGDRTTGNLIARTANVRDIWNNPLGWSGIPFEVAGLITPSGTVGDGGYPVIMGVPQNSDYAIGYYSSTNTIATSINSFVQVVPRSALITKTPVPQVVFSPSVASGIEILQTFSVSDDTYSKYQLRNNTTVDGAFAPNFMGFYNGSARSSLFFNGYIPTGSDSGSAEAITIAARISDSLTDPPTGSLSALSTRPVLGVYNNTLANAEFLANGNLTLRGALMATNFLSLQTNYVAANFVPVAGLVKICSSNGAIFSVTQLTTNLISGP